MSKKRAPLGKLPKKKSNLRNRVIRELKDLPRVSERAQLNYALITSEFQSYLLVVNALKPYVEKETKLYKSMIDHIAVLEAEAITELRIVFDIVVPRGQLAETTIMDMDSELRAVLDAKYHESLINQKPNYETVKLSALATYRRLNDVLYPSFAPIHAILAFVQSGNFDEQFTAYLDTLAVDYVPKDDDVTELDLKLMLNTLVHMATTPSKEYPDLLQRVNQYIESIISGEIDEATVPLNIELVGILIEMVGTK